MMFPSSSTVTPLGRVNSPSLVPSHPRNCENIDLVRENLWLSNEEYLGAAEIGLYHQQSVVVEVSNNGLTGEIFY